MTVTLDNIGKKFGKEWIFRHLRLELAEGEKCVVLGGNGSGKSTLLQVISGFISPNEGTVIYKMGDRTVEDDKVPALVSFASPYIQLIEDFTAQELVEHVRSFKSFSVSATEVLQIAQLENSSSKMIRQFSSGMKQRLKLSLAILSDTPLLLLDEPLSNLDKQGISWYRKMIADHGIGKTIVACSNAIEEEYFFCTRRLDVTDFKNSPAPR